MSSSSKEVRDGLEFILGLKVSGAGEVILEPDFITQNKNALIYLSLLLAKQMPNLGEMTLRQMHFLDDAPNNIREATKLLSIDNAHQITISPDGEKGDRLQQRAIVLQSLRTILQGVTNAKKPVAIGFDWGEVLETCFDTEDFENYDTIGSDVKSVLLALKAKGCVFIDVSNDLDFARHSQLLKTHAGFPLHAAATGALVPLYRTFILSEALKAAVSPALSIELTHFVLQTIDDIATSKQLSSLFNLPKQENTKNFQSSLESSFPAISIQAKTLATQLFYAIGNCRHVAETSYQLMLPALLEGRVSSSADNNSYKDTSIKTLGIPNNFRELVQQYGREHLALLQGGESISEAHVLVQSPPVVGASVRVDPERALKYEMILKLKEYTKRIQSYEKAGKIDFTSGFRFFKDSQGINREVNYQLATTLITALGDTNAGASSVSEILNGIDKTRADIRAQVLSNTPAKNKHCWLGDWGNQSSQLRSILSDLQTMASADEAVVVTSLN